jgi:WD40 repeat protein
VRPCALVRRTRDLRARFATDTRTLDRWLNKVRSGYAAIVVGVAAALLLVGCSDAQVTSHNFPLTLRQTEVIATPNTVSAVAWSPDGAKLAAAIDAGTKIVVWDRAGHLLSQFDVDSGGPETNLPIAFVAGAWELVFAPPQSAGDKVALSIRDAASGRVISNIELSEQPPSPAIDFAVSQDQRFVALFTASSRELPVAEVRAAGAAVKRWPVGKGPDSVSFFAGGRKLVVSSLDGIVHVLDPRSSSLPAEFKAFQSRDAAEVVAGSPDGKLILAGVWGTNPDSVRVLDANDGKLVASFPATHAWVQHAAWDPLGRYAAFNDSGQNLYLWNPQSPRASYAVLHVPGLYCFAIAPDGRQIAVAGDAGVVLFEVN